MNLRITMVAVAFVAIAVCIGGCGEKQQSFSITTGGTGGAYYPLGGALAGKRGSVGSPGSVTEIMAMRILEAYGLDQSINRERLSVAESVNALKAGKINAFFWAGGLPTAAVTDLAATPGVTIRLLDHAQVTCC
jgi:TRAP-type uncharacterized transport system substrate-binding protein